MGELERIVATSDAYQRAKDLLLLEELILANMSPQSTETRAWVHAQQGRVSSLKGVVGHFAMELAPEHEETGG